MLIARRKLVIGVVGLAAGGGSFAAVAASCSDDEAPPPSEEGNVLGALSETVIVPTAQAFGTAAAALASSSGFSWRARSRQLSSVRSSRSGVSDTQCCSMAHRSVPISAPSLGLTLNQYSSRSNGSFVGRTRPSYRRTDIRVHTIPRGSRGKFTLTSGRSVSPITA